MENASKALIIAASILLAILIIAMGVRIFNQAQSSYDSTSLDATEINMFNSKFERYDNKQLGSQVKSLISFTISNASTNENDPSKLPTVVPSGIADASTATGSTAASNAIQAYVDTLSTIRSKIVSTHQYTVELDYGNTGLITGITITY